MGLLNDFHFTLLKVKVTLQCLGIYLSVLCRSKSSEPFERFIVNFNQMFLSVRRCAVCINQGCRLKIMVNFQGHGIYHLQFPVRSVSLEPFERFSLNFTQVFLLVRLCAVHMTQLFGLEVNVTVQSHGIYP